MVSDAAIRSRGIFLRVFAVGPCFYLRLQRWRGAGQFLGGRAKRAAAALMRNKMYSITELQRVSVVRRAEISLHVLVWSRVPRPK